MSNNANSHLGIGTIPNPWMNPPSTTVTTNFTPLRKVRLTLNEVLTLRRAGGADEELGAVLKKLTPLIEVEVDL